MCETALSDFHKLVVTVLKSTFPKSHSKIIKYRSYRDFSNDLLRDNFKNHLLSKQNMTLEFTSLTRFTRILIETRNKHAPIKKNIIAESTQILLHKAYRAIMLRSRRRYSFLKERYLKSKKSYNKQHNIWVKIFRKGEERTLSKKINLSEITGNKKFWKTVSPLFDNKVKTNHKINIIEKIFYQHLVRRLLKHLKSISMKLCQSST